MFYIWNGIIFKSDYEFTETNFFFTLGLMPPVEADLWTLCPKFQSDLTGVWCEWRHRLILHAAQSTVYFWFNPVRFVPKLKSCMDRLGVVLMIKEVWKVIVLGLEFSFVFSFPVLSLRKEQMVQNRLDWKGMCLVSWL